MMSRFVLRYSPAFGVVVLMVLASLLILPFLWGGWG